MRELAPACGKKSQAIRRRNALRDGKPRELAEGFTRAKLNADQVLAIRLEYAAGGVSTTALAAKYGVKSKTIVPLLKHETWRDVGGPVALIKARKLTPELVRNIREDYARGGWNHPQLAQKYGVCRASISLVLEGKHWGHVK